MPTGVIDLHSRWVTMNPLHSGTMAMMHSQQPQVVIGRSIMVYMQTDSVLPWVRAEAVSLMEDHSPVLASIMYSLVIGTGWQTPIGSIS